MVFALGMESCINSVFDYLQNGCSRPPICLQTNAEAVYAYIGLCSGETIHTYGNNDDLRYIARHWTYTTPPIIFTTLLDVSVVSN